MIFVFALFRKNIYFFEMQAKIDDFTTNLQNRRIIKLF